MVTFYRSIPIVFAIHWFAASGCASRDVPGRLYALDRAEVVPLSLSFSGSRSGRAEATFPSGEEFEGEFAFWGAKGETDSMRVGDPLGEFKARDKDRENVRWPELYGYGTESKAEPVGTAVLVGTKGSTLEVVFFHAILNYSVVGDGVARDNHGNLYRVLVGNID